MPGFGVEREEDLDFQGVERLGPGGGELEWTSEALARVWRVSEALEC
jgi:hypothetical protein